MAKTFVQPGNILEHANSSGSAISAGDVVVMGDIVGVAEVDIPDGESGNVRVTGVHSLAKASGTAWTQGDSLDWDAAAGAFEKDKATPAAGDVENCAVAAKDAASGDTTGNVKLTPGTGTAV